MRSLNAGPVDRDLRSQGLPESIRRSYFSDSDTHTVGSWKGTASYYHVSVDGKTHWDNAWYYPTPKDAAAEIRDYVAFWRGVEVRD